MARTQNESQQTSREALELEGLGPSAETMELAALQASHRGRLSMCLRRARGLQHLYIRAARGYCADASPLQLTSLKAWRGGLRELRGSDLCQGQLRSSGAVCRLDAALLPGFRDAHHGRTGVCHADLGCHPPWHRDSGSVASSCECKSDLVSLFVILSAFLRRSRTCGS